MQIDQVFNTFPPKLSVPRVRAKICQFSDSLSELVKIVDDALLGEISVVLYADRQYALSRSNPCFRRGKLAPAKAGERLDAEKHISDFLHKLVARISQTPDYIIAKGGITSYYVATKGLKVKEALVLGQSTPGVPVWQMGDESKYPGLLYVVFPGNVGSDKSLYEVYTKFRQNLRQRPTSR